MTFTNYHVGDFLIRIKNASLADRDEIVCQSTKLVKNVADALKKDGFLSEVKVKNGLLTAKLAKANKRPVIIDLKLISKPGLRIYKNVSELKGRKNGSSILFLSTPKGILSNKKAIKENVGGEVIVEIW